jgi:hypothetical protein
MGKLYCPQCGGEVEKRERRPNGNDICVNQHVYPSRLSRPACPRDNDGDGNCGNPTCVHCRQRQYGLPKAVGPLGMLVCPCELCDTPTQMTGTKRCNRCWELESRIERDPQLAQKILDRINGVVHTEPVKGYAEQDRITQAWAEKLNLDPDSF